MLASSNLLPDIGLENYSEPDILQYSLQSQLCFNKPMYDDNFV